MVKGVSLLMWLIGKFLVLKGVAIVGIVFELVSKMSGRRQYTSYLRNFIAGPKFDG